MEYAVSVASHTPSQTTTPTVTELGPVTASGLSWGEELSREGEASATCDPKTLDSSITDAVAEILDNDDTVTHLELFIHRGATRVHRGPIIGLQVSGGGDEWTFVSRGPLYWLRYWHVIAETVHTGVDQFTIAASLIDQWQAEDYGNRGLDTSAVGTSGVTRDRTYAEGDDVFGRLTELAEVANGFDVWVDMDDLDVHFGTKGSDLTGSVVLDRRGITDAGLSVSLAAGDIASDALGLSTDETPLTSTSVNTTLRSSFGKTGIVGSFSGVSVQTTLDDHTTALQDARTRPLVSPSPRLFPVSGAGVLDFTTGDTVQFVPRIGVALALNRRVQRKTITVGEEGQEEIGVAFE